MENNEQMKMSLMEAWKTYQSLKYTFSVSNKEQIIEIFEKEFEVKIFDLKENIKAVCELKDFEVYKNDEEKLKSISLLMTQQEWLWRPVEDGLMPFLFEILDALDRRRKNNTVVADGPKSPTE